MAGKPLILYYSRTGNTGKTAGIVEEGMANYGIEADIREIEVEGKVGFRAIGRMSKKIDVHLMNKDFDLSGYDVLIVGSPIWAGAPSMPCMAYLDRAEGRSQMRIATFMTGGARNMDSNKKSSERMAKQLTDMGYSYPFASLNLRFRWGRIIEGEECIPGFIGSIVRLIR